MIAPNDIADKINHTVNNMLDMPLARDQIIDLAQPVTAIKPFASADHTPFNSASSAPLSDGSLANAITNCGCKITDVTPPINAPAVIATNAGTRFTARNSTTNNGINVRIEMSKLSSSAFSAGVVSKALGVYLGTQSNQGKKHQRIRSSTPCPLQM